MDMQSIQNFLSTTVTELAIKILAAIAFWIIGRWLIGKVVALIQAAMNRNKVDPTLTKYLGSIVTIALNIALVLGILGYFGIQTTTFAALIAAAGVAIGLAWSGLLAHFAAGAFLVVLRPMKVGDFVTVAGVTGTITELGLFTTTVNTPDNVQTIIGNNKVFSDTIQNFTTNPFRRVDLKCQLSGAADHKAAMALLREKIATIPNVLPEPKVDVEIIEFTLVGPVLAVRPYCHNDNYWQVYFDTNKALAEVGSANNWPIPAPHQVLRQPA